jgi:hypothetical protein
MSLLSFSGIDCFTTCERKYYLERILKIPEEESLPLVVGDVYHKILADTYLQPNLNLATRIETQLNRAAERLKPFDVNMAEFREELTDNIPRVLTLQGPAMFRPVAVNGTLMVERKFADERIGYCGVLDLLSDHAPLVNEDGRVVTWQPEHCVVDWKTTASNRRRTDRSVRTSAQLALYAIEADVRCGVFVEIPRNLDRPINTRVVRYSEKDLVNWRRYLENIRDAILSRGTEEKRFKMAAPDMYLCNPAYCRHWERCFQL